MSYVLRNGLIVPKREIVRPKKSAHIRVPRAYIILRRVHWPIRQPIVAAVARNADSGSMIAVSSVAGVFTNLSGITVPAGTTLLIALVEVESSTPGTVTAVWDNVGTPQTMTQVGSTLIVTGGGGPGSIAVLGVVNPTAGQKEIRVNWGGVSTNVNGYIAQVSFTGTSTSSVAAATEGFASNNGTGTTASVTSGASIPASDMAAVFFLDCGVSFTGSFVNGATQADGGTAIGISTNNTNNAAAEYYTGAGSAVAASAGLAGSDVWGAVIVGIKAAGGAVVASSSTMMTMGVG